MSVQRQCEDRNRRAGVHKLGAAPWTPMITEFTGWTAPRSCSRRSGAKPQGVSMWLFVGFVVYSWIYVSNKQG